MGGGAWINGNSVIRELDYKEVINWHRSQDRKATPRFGGSRVRRAAEGLTQCWDGGKLLTPGLCGLRPGGVRGAEGSGRLRRWKEE